MLQSNNLVWCKYCHHSCSNLLHLSCQNLLYLGVQDSDYQQGNHLLIQFHLFRNGNNFLDHSTHSYCSEFGKNLPGQISVNSPASQTGPSQLHLHELSTSWKWSEVSLEYKIISVAQLSQELCLQTLGKISPQIGAVPNIWLFSAKEMQNNLKYL